MDTDGGLSLVGAVNELEHSRYSNAQVKKKEDGIDALLLVMTHDLEKCAMKHRGAVVVIVGDKKTATSKQITRETNGIEGRWNVSDRNAQAVIQCHPTQLERATVDARAEMSKYMGPVASLLVYVDGADTLNDMQAQNLCGMVESIVIGGNVCKAALVRATHTREQIHDRLCETLGRLRQIAVKRHYSITRNPQSAAGPDK